MKPRTEELLYLLLWSVDQLMHPTFRNLNESFEGWAYRKGFFRQLHELEARQLIERRPGHRSADAIFRLSEKGRLIALGGRDPHAQWRRCWDGRWRIVLFDLPELKASARRKLRRFLQDNGFGYLQNSVWISPDPLNAIIEGLSAQSDDVESIMTLEARPAAGETDADLVAGSWDFEEINRCYEECLAIFGQLPRSETKAGPRAESLLRWAKRERSAWRKAMSLDPLLPATLLPPGYLGQEAWRERVRVLAEASRLIG